MAGTLRDAVIGAAVGDALGVPFEFKMRGSFECTDMVGYGSHYQPAGTWSDDTSMMLATCDSIRELGRIDTDDLLERFRAWLFHGAYTPDGDVFDVGNTTSAALRQGYGCTGEYQNGNGSLMRIAPLAFCDATDDEIRAVSAITHANPTSTEPCVDFVHIIRDAVADPLATKAGLQAAYGSLPRTMVQSSGYVMHTFDAALWCFATTDDYRSCVIEAVNLGDDTDTTACVAGALAGAAYGVEAIPPEWLAAMRGMELLESCLF